MIASLAATGLATGLRRTSSGGGGAPIVEDSPVPEETPTDLDTLDPPQDPIYASTPHKAIIETNKGNIEIQLYTDAPRAVDSFAYLAREGFYNGLTFFYVNQDFVAQAGDPSCESSGEFPCTGDGGPGYSLPVEQTKEGHEQWAVVAPTTTVGQEVHGSQFRILFKPDPRLDGTETVFGKVVDGKEILEGLDRFVPCSVDQTDDDCDPDPDMSSALEIKQVIVEPA